MTNDRRQSGVTGDWSLTIMCALAAALVLWIALFAAYRLDRADAASVASLTVLLVIPPLLSYYLAMELTSERLPLPWQIAGTFGLALVWLILQRLLVYPLIGFSVSIGESVANFILLPAFGIAAWLGVRSFADRRRLQRALELQRQTELRLLNAQLAPHTLFNMLNTVYSVLLTDHHKAVPLFLSMADALRHMVDRTRKPWIPLRDELAFLENYAALERARDPEHVKITIRAAGDVDVPLPPMMLATLFENAVTHGRFADGALRVAVEAEIEDARLRLSVTNSFPPDRKAGAGVGLANVRERLRLLYPGRAALSTKSLNGEYFAQIDIVP